MKVYVSKLPKSCEECPCMNEDYERGCWCNIETSLDIQTDYDKETFTSKFHRQRHENCPLQSLSDYTKQVRKEVVQEIMTEFDTSNMNQIDEKLYPPTQEAILIGKGFKTCKDRLFKKLDEIEQGETK